MKDVIEAYKNYSQRGVDLLNQMTQGECPLHSWKQGKVREHGYLDELEMISYQFHGRGCEVTFGEVVVDFDFDENCRLSPVDNWKLYNFFKTYVAPQRLLSREEFAQALAANYS
ncbi:MAG: hypothetical protein ACI9FU_002112 [Granulosicoccus sp.]